MKTKNITLIVFALLCILLFNGSALQAQSLWSPTFGAGGGGTLVQLDLDSGGFTKVYDFRDSTGSNPMGSVLQATNGKVYGTCLNGGSFNSCVIYSYDPATHTYTDLWDFDIAHGDYPMSGMVQAPNGILYGASSAGGAVNAGVIYSFNTATNVYTDMYELAGDSTGFAPCGNPVPATDGKLYGLASGVGTFQGIDTGFGNIYSYDISSGTYADLHNFGGITDGYPFGSLFEHNGIFYGMTSGIPQYSPALIQGIPGFSPASLPAVNNGNIFSFDPATRTYTNLHRFDSVNGGAPYGSLFLAGDGKLYGMTSAGGAHNLGVIFSFDPATNTYLKLFDFDDGHGSAPMGDLMQATDGNLYGVTSAGGSYGYGVVFRFNPVTLNCNVLTNFDGNNGGAPLGGAFSIVNTTAATGILAPVSNRSLSVYPVPAHNDITVSIESAPGENPVFTLTDINGRAVWSPKPEAVNGNSQIKLDLSFLESGIYFLQATTGDNVITKKIVRQ